MEIINCTFNKNSVWVDRTFKDDDGGAIWIGKDATLSLVGSNFTQNKAKHYGGVIYSEAKEFTIVNCTFDHNEAFNKYGGALYVDKSLNNIENTKFTNNFARHGGAIYINNNDKELEIKNSIFHNNVASMYNSNSNGGAIYNDGKKILVYNSNFTSNRAWADDDGDKSTKRYKGGAIYSTKELYVEESRFENNKAFDDGGAICAEGGMRMGSHCYFIGNSVDNSNPTYANKGGAIYTTTFDADLKDAVFIYNRAYYGGAIYINKAVDMTFDTCYFTDNSALYYKGGSGSGAAIYLDSSSSKISLTNNVFSNNNAYTDKSIYNCGYYQTVKNNWWATNNPNFDDGYLVEWHKFGSDGKIKDSDPLRIVFESMDRETTSKFYDVTLILKFVDSGGYPAGKIINWNATFKANKPANFTWHKLGENNATIVFTPTDVGDYEITAKVLLFEGKLNIHVQGDFGTLQELINDTESGTTLNLTRDYTYSAGADTITKGIVIDKPLTINGNGFTIDSKGQSSIFKILSDNVIINNLTLIGGSSEGEPDDDGNPTTNTYKVIEIQNANNTMISNCIITNASEVSVTSVGGNNTIIDNCTFTHNSGALDLKTPNTLVNNSRFYFNYGGNGGAINADLASLRILNSEFLNNTAGEHGGAIYGSGANALLLTHVYSNIMRLRLLLDWVEQPCIGKVKTQQSSTHYS